MKILLALFILGFLVQLITALTAGKGDVHRGRRVLNALLVWLPLIALTAVAVFTAIDIWILALVLLAVYALLAFLSKKRSS
ncbi:MAG: hypothetical protein E6Q40_16635 [Cupriavidus sp.]|nr:MAG: hypothetical protein E6Q40_16635 [Cupriavidus sp.]